MAYEKTEVLGVRTEAAHFGTAWRALMQRRRSATRWAVLIAIMVVASLSTVQVATAASAFTADSLDVPSNVVVDPGASFSFDLVVTNQTGSAGTSGLGAYDLTLTYDSSVINITTVTQLAGITGAKSATTGSASSAGFTTSPVVGTFNLITFSGTAGSTPGASTSLSFAVKSFNDENDLQIAIGGLGGARTGGSPQTIVATGIVQLTTPPTASIAAPTYQVTEGDTGTVNVPVQIDLDRQGDTTNITVGYATEKQTATDGRLRRL